MVFLFGQSDTKNVQMIMNSKVNIGYSQYSITEKIILFVKDEFED